MRYLLLLGLLVAGCGYQSSRGHLVGNAQRLYLPLAVNQTAEPFIENVLAKALTEVLARQQGVDLVASADAADARLLGTIVRYQVGPLSYDSNDRISVLRADMTIRFKLVNPQGRLLWQGSLSRQESYAAAADKNQQEDLESIAIATLVDNLADDLLARLLTGF